jgi:hypothetical protein
MAGCSLDRSSKHNWVENEGGLPEYICEIARAIERGGKDLESAIPIAISRCRVWATGKGVNAKTQAKAAAAIAQWDAKKARANAKGAKVAASEAIDSDLTVGADALLRLTVFSASTYDDVVDKFLRLMS